MTNEIRRLPHVVKGRSVGSIYGGLVWTAAVANEKHPTIEGQTADLFAKLERQLAAAGSDKSRILSATIHLANMDDKALFDAAWAAWMGDDPEGWPQRACTGAVLVAGYLVEIALVAAVA